MSISTFEVLLSLTTHNSAHAATHFRYVVNGDQKWFVNFLRTHGWIVSPFLFHRVQHNRPTLRVDLLNLQMLFAACFRKHTEILKPLF